ncbi:heat shock protein transcriptional repressor HspR [Cellulomonas sp. C5510]|uniref:heat shock protein transcriptional repressor HspR n=1 Tax=Cellulomonas sp. C5510 TaxID=2871170 RepID=UPI001C97B2C4|nr:helix-turn-helix transcriptional regulator [Cellulomonas sp. C5510]QZN85525.1 helix-turn-helix transcriptional regulator [Cellulomonas sp. C5510]
MVSEDAQVYVISVAAELAGMHPQTLRQYDRLGLVQPGRTRGRGRRYSLRDIATLREVQRLSQEEGVNLAGIKRILELESEVERLRRQVEYLRAFAEPGRRVFTAHPSGDVVAMGPLGRSQRRSAASAEDPRAAGARGAIVLWRPSGR